MYEHFSELILMLKFSTFLWLIWAIQLVLNRWNVPFWLVSYSKWFLTWSEHSAEEGVDMLRSKESVIQNSIRATFGFFHTLKKIFVFCGQALLCPVLVKHHRLWLCLAVNPKCLISRVLLLQLYFGLGLACIRIEALFPDARSSETIPCSLLRGKQGSFWHLCWSPRLYLHALPSFKLETKDCSSFW